MHKHKISLYNLIVILVHLMMPDHLRYYQTYSFAMKILNNMNYLHFHFIYIRWLWIEKQKKKPVYKDLSTHWKDPKFALLFRSNVETDSFGFSFDQKSTINLSIFFSLFHFIWLIFECKFKSSGHIHCAVCVVFSSHKFIAGYIRCICISKISDIFKSSSIFKSIDIRSSNLCTLLVW